MEEIKIKDKQESLMPSHVLGLSIVIYIVATLISVFIAMIVTSYMANGESSHFHITSITTAVIACPVMYRLLRNGNLWKFRECPWKAVIGYAALGLFLAYIAQTAIEYFFIVFDLYDHESVQELYRLNDMGMDGNVILRVLGIMAAPAVCEEMLFRGAMFWALRVKRGFLFSSVVTSLIFGAAHDIGLYMLMAFLVGMILCIVLEITQSLIVPMILHFCNNLLAALAANSGIGSAWEFESMTMNIMMLAALLFASVVIFAVLAKKVILSGKKGAIA